MLAFVLFGVCISNVAKMIKKFCIYFHRQNNIFRIINLSKDRDSPTVSGSSSGNNYTVELVVPHPEDKKDKGVTVDMVPLQITA